MPENHNQSNHLRTTDAASFSLAVLIGHQSRPDIALVEITIVSRSARGYRQLSRVLGKWTDPPAGFIGL
jgi:hypothetical protein